MNNEKIIIIGGGVGPQAGTVLHNYIIENTLQMELIRITWMFTIFQGHQIFRTEH
ncbi:MAG: hypothetical protein J7L71_11255 [Spirochaetaceae bacterium]|nr:hypothetical protein [Spirochaetaceae bacterium]